MRLTLSLLVATICHGVLFGVGVAVLSRHPQVEPVAAQAVDVAVDANGTPTRISVNRSSGYPLLDRAALDAVRRWTFDPARAGGTPVFSQVVVPVRFSLGEGP
jgi:TonB family protein